MTAPSPAGPERETVEALGCVICHASIKPEDSGLCDEHKYDEQIYGSDVEALARDVMASENVGRSDLNRHPLEWHWHERFNEEDRAEYRAIARAVLASPWLAAYVAAAVETARRAWEQEESE